MVIRVAANLRCGNKIRHATAGFPLAIAVINDPMVGPRSWFLRCDDCIDALKLSDDPDPYLVAFLHGHDPTVDPRPDRPADVDPADRDHLDRSWIHRRPVMTDATDQPLPDVIDAYALGESFPGQQAEFLGRILDPVRAKALHEAVNLLHAVEVVEFRPDDDLPGLAVLWARTFEAYLDPEVE